MNNVSSPRTDDESIEQEIRRKDLTAPRVTPADIEANIAAEHHFTIGQALRALGHPTDEAFDLTTIVALKLRNGFTVYGKSACASPENFNAELGIKIARTDAVNQLWPLMGYALREKLAAVPATFQDRVRQEKAELDEKLAKLRIFLDSTTFLVALLAPEQDRLRLQLDLMADYSEVLGLRIAAF